MAGPNSRRGLLLASAARTASGNALAALGQLAQFRRCLLLLDVTAAAAAVGDLLDVYVQKNVGLDAATAIWTDFVHFTQVLGNGGAKQFVAEITTDGQTPENELHAIQDAALAVGVTQGPWSDDWRIKWVIAGATPSFTFRLVGLFAD